MRTRTTLLILALAPGCAATAETVEAHAQQADAAVAPQRSEEPGARSLARDLYGQLARQMLERAETIREVEEKRQGLGGMLVGYDLYEAPRPSPFPGLCEAAVHQIAVGPEPTPTVRGEQTISRFYAIGGSLPQSADGRERCAALPTARNFFDAPSVLIADEAVRTFEFAQLWSRTTPLALTVRCRLADGPCAAPGAILQGLSPQRLRSVVTAECPSDLPGRGRNCFVYQVDQVGGGAEGSWIVTIRGPERPLQVDIRPAPIVVT
jgi:hypothetical protein